MHGDVILFIILAGLVYFIGHYGYTAGWWGYPIYVFGFTTIAGLLFSMGVMNYMFPSLSIWGQLIIAAGATIGTVVVSLLILKVVQHKIK